MMILCILGKLEMEQSAGAFALQSSISFQISGGKIVYFEDFTGKRIKIEIT